MYNMPVADTLLALCDKLDKPAHLTIRVLWVLVSDCETSAATL